MQASFDTTGGTARITGPDGTDVEVDLYSEESFAALSRLWVKVGWSRKYQYGFSWFGRPVIQLADDMVRIQEKIWEVQPDVVVETGVAHGGSLVFYASLLRAMGKGRVVGIDIEIRPHNREAIEAHPLADLITLVEGSSTDPATVAEVADHVAGAGSVLVLLDSNHTKSHVAAELEAYAPMVTPGSYIVATDGIMWDLHDAPRGEPGWATDHPMAAAAEFVAGHPEFQLEDPPHRPFDETDTEVQVTHWPGAYLKRTR